MVDNGNSLPIVGNFDARINQLRSYAGIQVSGFVDQISPRASLLHSVLVHALGKKLTNQAAGHCLRKRNSMVAEATIVQARRRTLKEMLLILDIR